ncbi:MAG: hypothetical protein O2930_08205 [Acidobacteria bacterium]|nr:hypothetical protein [Acidobacteriota bacterium]
MSSRYWRRGRVLGVIGAAFLAVTSPIAGQQPGGVDNGEWR